MHASSRKQNAEWGSGYIFPWRTAHGSTGLRPAFNSHHVRALLCTTDGSPYGLSVAAVEKSDAETLPQKEKRPGRLPRPFLSASSEHLFDIRSAHLLMLKRWRIELHSHFGDNSSQALVKIIFFNNLRIRSEQPVNFYFIGCWRHAVKIIRPV